jgi:hypothetical protein
MVSKLKNYIFFAEVSITSSFLAFLFLSFIYIPGASAANKPASNISKSAQLSPSHIGVALGTGFNKVITPAVKVAPKKIVRKPVKHVQLAYARPSEEAKEQMVAIDNVAIDNSVVVHSAALDAPVLPLEMHYSQTNTTLTTLVVNDAFQDTGMSSMDSTVLELASTSEVIDDRPDRLDAYYKKYKMPLSGYGQKFVEVADSCGIDWRLLPAISVQESTGGKYMRLNNPFGWASARIGFKDFNEAIEVVGKNLCGLNEKTASYYKNKTTYQKLWSYNGTVNHAYPGQVLAIMEKF